MTTGKNNLKRCAGKLARAFLQSVRWLGEVWLNYSRSFRRVLEHARYGFHVGYGSFYVQLYIVNYIKLQQYCLIISFKLISRNKTKWI